MPTSNPNRACITSLLHLRTPLRINTISVSESRMLPNILFSRRSRTYVWHSIAVALATRSVDTSLQHCNPVSTRIFATYPCQLTGYDTLTLPTVTMRCSCTTGSIVTTISMHMSCIMILWQAKAKLVYVQAHLSLEVSR